MPHTFDHPPAADTASAAASPPWVATGAWPSSGDDAAVGYEAALPFLTAAAADSDMPAPWLAAHWR